MKIKIYRQTNKNNAIIEISTEKTKILLDGGVNLEENEVLIPIELKEQYNFSDINAVFLSHYHTDHITMAKGLLDEVPVYTGKLTSKIALAAEKYKAKKPFSFAGYYVSGEAIAVGDIKVTPYLVDDNIHEGYLLLIEGDNKSIMYTGDFHANGRKSFEEMLANLPKKADVLICEDGVITEDDINLVTERDIEEKAAELIASKKGSVFILQSVTDFERASTMFRASKRNKRVFLQDLYTSQAAVAMGKAMPNSAGWTGVRTYLTTGYKPEHFRYKMFTELPRANKADIETQKFTMCIRTSMKKYMKTLSQAMRFKDGVIINAMQGEDFKSEETKAFLAFAEDKGLEVFTMHSSGHSNAMALKALAEAVKPTIMIPLETKNVRWLTNEYPNISVLSDEIIQC